MRPLISKLNYEYPKILLEVVEGFSVHVNDWLGMRLSYTGLLNNALRQKYLATENILIEELLLVFQQKKMLKGTQKKKFKKSNKHL
jgi:hypothetical protein